MIFVVQSSTNKWFSPCLWLLCMHWLTQNKCIFYFIYKRVEGLIFRVPFWSRPFWSSLFWGGPYFYYSLFIYFLWRVGVSKTCKICTFNISKTEWSIARALIWSLFIVQRANTPKTLIEFCQEFKSSFPKNVIFFPQNACIMPCTFLTSRQILFQV